MHEVVKKGNQQLVRLIPYLPYNGEQMGKSIIMYTIKEGSRSYRMRKRSCIYEIGYRVKSLHGISKVNFMD